MRPPQNYIKAANKFYGSINLLFDQENVKGGLNVIQGFTVYCIYSRLRLKRHNGTLKITSVHCTYSIRHIIQRIRNWIVCYNREFVLYEFVINIIYYLHVLTILSRPNVKYIICKW